MPKKTTKKKLYLIDDNINSFKYVVFCLVNIIPEYNVIRAEQVAQLVHYNGRCCITTGNDTDLWEYWLALKSKNLSVEII